MKVPRKSRETALRLLFQWDMTKDAPDRVKRVYWESVKGEEAVRQAADRLFDATVERVEDIDRVLQKHTENWRLERLSAVDRNIMRMALGEFHLRPGLSKRIIIDEAIDIARRYSTDQAAVFINGVLDAVRREVAPSEPGSEDERAPEPEED